MKKILHISFYMTLIFYAMNTNAYTGIEEDGHNISIALAIGSLSYTLYKEENAEGAKQFGYTFLVSQSITAILKKAVGKTRPNGNCCESFPSGHATAAFASAAFIHQRYGLALAIPSYIGATFTAYSRVEADKHFVEDVVAGAAIAIWTSYQFTDAYQPDKGLFVPVLGKDVIGLSFQKAF